LANDFRRQTLAESILAAKRAKYFTRAPMQAPLLAQFMGRFFNNRKNARAKGPNLSAEVTHAQIGIFPYQLEINFQKHASVGFRLATSGEILRISPGEI